MFRSIEVLPNPHKYKGTTTWFPSVYFSGTGCIWFPFLPFRHSPFGSRHSTTSFLHYHLKSLYHVMSIPLTVNRLVFPRLTSELDRAAIKEILGISKARSFALLRQYRQHPDRLTLEYRRSTSKRLPTSIEAEIEKELMLDKNPTTPPCPSPTTTT